MLARRALRPQASSQLTGLRVAEFLEEVQGLLPGCVRGIGFGGVVQQVADGTQGLLLGVTVADAPADSQGTPETVRRGAVIAGRAVALVVASVQGQVGQWSPATNGLPSIYGCSGVLACFGSSATLLGDGDVLVAGGDAGLASNSHSSAEAVLYNPTTNSWTTTGSLNNSRLFQTASLLQNGQVLVAGGESFANHAPTRLASAELYTP